MSPIVPSVSPEHLADQLAVSLPRYAKIVDYSEAALFGVSAPGQEEHACRTIWTCHQRQALARELMAAQNEFMKHCNFPLIPTFIQAERHDYSRTILLNNCEVLGLGHKAVHVLATGMAVNHASDPVILTVATTATDVEEIHIYHPGTDYEILPSSIRISGGVATIGIPRVRMVALANDDNPDVGWPYSDTTKFESTVDIRRILLDTSQQIQVFGSNCSATVGWSNYWNAGYIRAADIGHIRLARPPASACNLLPHFMEVSYLCGWLSVPVEAEDAVIRLAHARMQSEPCGCDTLKMLWERDRTVPDVLTAERENCPFGMSNGAWQAWEYMQDMVCRRGRAL